MLKTLASVFVGMAFASCADVDIPAAVSSEKVSNLTYTVNGRDISLAWTLPSASNLMGVRITKDGTTNTDINELISSYLIKHAAVNTDMTYTVKAKYDDGRVSEGESVNIRIESDLNTKPAYLLPCNSVDELQDDDEIAAVEWFRSKYPDGVLLTPADLTSVYPDEINEIWIHVDRVGLNQGYENLPSQLVTAEALEALKNYVKQGGNLLLTKHATQLISAIGRIDDSFKPGLFGSGDGGEGTDIWTTNAVIGSGESEPYDHRSHQAFKDLEVSNQYEHESYPLIGPGWREDHNCMWDLNSYGLEPSPNVVAVFESITNSTVLATWGHVTDYCCGGIIEFNPTDEYLGRIIAIGLSAYEWNQNSGKNPYQSNIEKLTENCLEYLKQ